MVRGLKKTTKLLTLTAGLCGIFGLTAFAQQDPPSRVARLNYTNGNVSMEPAGVDDWAPADRNRPFSTGDYLYTDQGAQAELHLDVAVMRMSPQTSFGFLNLDNQTVQIKLSEGEMYFRVRNFGPNQVFEVDTPNAALTLVQNGIYVVSVDPNANTSYLIVREGQAQVTGGGQAFTVDQGNSVNLSGTDQLAYDVEQAPGMDDFENWSGQRDQHEMHLRTARYLPPTVIGYEDLDDYGGWQTAGEYGPVWYPNQVEVGWSPYHYGHWGWQDPWGYTWVDDSPWGFAPFHYGRWAFISGRWGWAPGPIAIGFGGPVVTPYYAPALVTFFGGSGWGVSIGIGFGGGASLGWVPLGWGEVYTPPYAVSQSYFREVNISNTRITNVTNITNVYNTVYVNHTAYNQTYANMKAPNAVMAMPQSAFASGRPVAQAARPVPAAQVAQIRPTAAVVGPPVAPTRQAVLATTGRGTAARPPAQVMQRQVVAKSAPPPAPVPFAAKQTYLQQHAGQPYNHAAMRQTVAPRAAPAAAAVVRAPAARPVAVHAGERHGNVPPAPAGRPGQPAAATRPGQPTPAPAAHGAPSNRPAVENRQPTPAPAAPAGRGTPPNMRPSNPPANAARPGEPTPAARPTERTPAAPSQPAARTPQPPPARGTPPNGRETPPAQPAARPAPTPERGTPPARPAPEARPTPAPARPTPEARPAPAPARPAPEARPTPPPARPAPEARPAPAPARPAPEARPAPAPARPAPEARPAPARPEARPAPERGTPPPARPERSTKDTKEPH
ncbi:MAG: FecR domain-containing protein [Acidobacteriaceae bacterium]|nr:FecR domain-containing protein [Acidobacteriaceae bacterium]MBV9781136.1 FecR domain-containing protein [Acidobacteriaceae bacterium]